MRGERVEPRECPVRWSVSWIVHEIRTRDFFGTDISKGCIGSKCMFWRVAGYDLRCGYCGLAGKPEQGTERSGGIVADPAEEVSA